MQLVVVRSHERVCVNVQDKDGQDWGKRRIDRQIWVLDSASPAAVHYFASGAWRASLCLAANRSLSINCIHLHHFEDLLPLSFVARTSSFAVFRSVRS